MNAVRKMASATAAGLMLATVAAGTAQAATNEEHYPETPKLNPTLPIINTYRGDDHMKANILNPKPVCNALEDYRTVIYRVDDKFMPAGTISATNDTQNKIPLTQELSKTQSIS